MKRRILIAAGEGTELSEVADELARLAPAWEFERAHGSLEALDRLTRDEWDGVVADMNLPGLNGLQLVNQIVRQWPRVHRVLLADLGELDWLLGCVGGVHQFLARPCEAQRIHVVFERAFAFEAWLPSQSVRALLGSLPRLPSPEAEYSAVVGELQKESPSVDRAAALVARDPVMAAKILQLANSAAYGPPLDESDPVVAVKDLGWINTRRMLLLAHTYSSFKELRGDGFDVNREWEHARRVSRLARRVAELEQAQSETLRQAATAGLLHDLGKVALATNLPEKFRRVLDLVQSQSLPFWEAEQQVFGATHSEVGGCLLAIWGLPPPVVEAVSLHHHPARLLSDGFSPVTAVHVADALAHAATPDAARHRLDRLYLADLRLADRLPVWWEGCLDLRTARDGQVDPGAEIE